MHGDGVRCSGKARLGIQEPDSCTYGCGARREVRVVLTCPVYAVVIGRITRVVVAPDGLRGRSSPSAPAAKPTMDGDPAAGAASSVADRTTWPDLSKWSSDGWPAALPGARFELGAQGSEPPCFDDDGVRMDSRRCQDRPIRGSRLGAPCPTPVGPSHFANVAAQRDRQGGRCLVRESHHAPGDPLAEPVRSRSDRLLGRRRQTTLIVRAVVVATTVLVTGVIARAWGWEHEAVRTQLLLSLLAVHVLLV